MLDAEPNKLGPNKGRGRPKGARNKLTILAKDAIQKAAEGLGGTKRLIEWAKSDPDNERVFWGQIYTKLLPVQLGNADDTALRIIVEKPH